MKRKILIEILCFLNDSLKDQKLTKSKKAKTEYFISILDSAIKKKDPMNYLLIVLSVAKLGELFKIIIEFFTSE